MFRKQSGFLSFEMSRPYPATPLTCPNCGHPATLNYCAQCGQETHLHKDTFWGLIAHFAGHYFHYDSKFWKTIKALWTAPGKLTRAYAEGKRARYIPPVSLYIFISALFFIVNALMLDWSVGAGERTREAANHQVVEDRAPVPDTAANITIRLNSPTMLHGLAGRLRQIDDAPEAQQREIFEKFAHQFPKLFFLMIPVTALLLKLAFVRRRGTYFVHHAIFSLHVHAFFFSLFLIEVLNPFETIDGWLTTILLVVFSGYFVAALRRVYGTGFVRSVLTTLFVGLVYFVVALIAFIAAALYVFSHL